MTEIWPVRPTNQTCQFGARRSTAHHHRDLHHRDTFSAQHSTISSHAWTLALLGIAVAEVLGRTAVLESARLRI
jgi:hypothetical protein